MLPVFATSALALILAPPALRGSPAARHRWPLLMSEDAACTIIGEEAGPEGKVWFACDDDDSSAVGGAECAEESFGTGGGIGILPDDGSQVLCKTAKVSGGGEAAAPERRKKEPLTFIGQEIAAKPLDGGECVIIGEQANGEVWYVCSDDASVEGATCSDEEFGTGGGLGILPQDGQKLCKAPAPQALGSIGAGEKKFKGSSFHGSGKK